MSTLTKILIILLAFSSIFLCGIVVTYVANADSYRQKLDEFSAEKDSLSKKVKELTKQVNDKAEQKKQAETKLGGEIASLNAKVSELKAGLENSEREKASLLAKVDNWTTITKDFYETNDKQGQILKNTLEELNKIQADQANDRVALNDAAAAQAEKAAVIESLEAERLSLLEQKAQLQSKIDRMLYPGKKIVRPVVPVTPKKETFKAAVAAGEDAALQGQITAIDVKNSMASISLGKADGVLEGMKFHITRGDDFVCDVQIIDVEENESVGLLELVQKQPQVGDVAATSL